MADQDQIKKVVEQLSAKFQIAQKEVILALQELVKGKSNAEALAIINNLDINKVMASKTSAIISGYTSGNIGTLLTKEQFALITEETLQVLLTQSEQYLAGEITAMSNVVKQEVIAGIMNNKTSDEILETIGKKGYGAGVGMKRIVTDGMNNYSRAVSRMMMEEAPKNEKYVYIGPADEKTRSFCLSAIQLGPATMEKIRSMGGEWVASLSEGGGINCRHGWEIVTEDVRSQFYRKEEAEDILDA